jgi:arsenite methyltransferase
MNNYEETVKFWDERFGKNVSEKKYYNPKSPLKLNELEEGLKWLVKDSDSIIDFGCGSGTLLFRSLLLGAKNVIGIDISPKAIELANQTSMTNENNNETHFIEGGIESLKDIKTNSIDAAISSNTIDNILPQDALIVLNEFNRILKKNGKLLIKLNDALPKAVFEDDYYQLISEDFYKEKCGLYFWNLSDTKFKEIVSQYFNIVKYEDVPFPDANYKNRLYYLKNLK